MNVKPIALLALILQLCSVLTQPSARAEGTEVLGPPEIEIESGSRVIAAGTGLARQPASIYLNVPQDSKIRQVLLYWEGASQTLPDDTIEVNGVEIAGEMINQPLKFLLDQEEVQYASFRADITKEELVKNGSNRLAIDGLNNSVSDDGAGVLVILEDASGESHLEIRDGLDWAYWGFEDEAQKTVPQKFTFEPEPFDRLATLTLFVGSVDQVRPNQIQIDVGQESRTLINPLFSNNGDQWDTTVLIVDIPAQAESLSVQIISTPVNNRYGGGASFAWVTAAFSLPRAPSNPGTGTPVYWKNHPKDWPAESIYLGGVYYTKIQAISLMKLPQPKGNKLFSLVEHLIAAKLNVRIGNDASCIQEAIEAADEFLELHPLSLKLSTTERTWKTIEPVFELLVQYNEGKLCAPPRR